MLLEAERRKCEFLERGRRRTRACRLGPGRGAGADWAGVALAKALAPPPVAAEWCLPLVRPGGAGVLWVGESADLEARRRASPPGSPASCAEAPRGLAVLRKTGADAGRLPAARRRRRKRPLA